MGIDDLGIPSFDQSVIFLKWIDQQSKLIIFFGVTTRGMTL